MNSFKQFQSSFETEVFMIASNLSGLPVGTLTSITRLDNIVTIDTASQWADAFTQITRQYVGSAKVSRGECVDMTTLGSAIALIRSKIKPERLYTIDRIKMWVKAIRGNDLPGSWQDIRDSDKLVEDLGMSSQQIDLFAKVSTRLCREFKPSVTITISDIRNDGIESKTVGECADYVLDKAGITF